MVATIDRPINSATARPTANVLSQSTNTDWLQGIRGIAALMVFLTHAVVAAEYRSGHHVPEACYLLCYLGPLAVAVFIFLSGFTLGLPATRDGWRLKAPLAFFERRANRIIPAYFAAIAASIGIGIYITKDISPYIFLTPDFWRPLFLIQDTAAAPYFNTPLWSLAVEWHIYAAFPLLLWSARRWGPVRAIVGTFAVTCIGHHAAALAGYHYSAFELYAVFALGVFTSWLVQNPSRLPAVSFSSISKIGFIIIVSFCMLIGWANYPTDSPTLNILTGVLCIPVFIALYHNELPSATRLLNCRVVSALGAISYSLYLLHWPILQAVMIYTPKHSAIATLVEIVAIALPISLVVAGISYALFERPYLRARVHAKAVS